jgi:hypothetical protein
MDIPRPFEVEGTQRSRAQFPHVMAMSKQEQRIHSAARAMLPKMQRKGSLELPGGRWDVSYDFKKIPRLTWTHKVRSKEPFVVIPSKHQIIGIGPLDFGYAEKKLKAAADALKS